MLLRKSIISATARAVGKCGASRVPPSFRSAAKSSRGPKDLVAVKTDTSLTWNPSSRYFSSLSSFDEPDPSLFATDFKESTIDAVADHDIQLRKDIRSMGSLLGKVIQEEHNGFDVFKKVEDMRALAKSWRAAGAGRDVDKAQEAGATFEELARYASTLSDDELFKVSRAFSHFLALANAAEAHHRIRRLNQVQGEAAELGISSGALYNKKDSCGMAISNLLDQGVSADEIYEALTSQYTELVLTAHPTEVNRRTILDKQRRIQQILNAADLSRHNGLMTPFDQKQLTDSMYREISGIWLSDEISRSKPTPQMEAEKGTAVVDTILWKTLPRFMRKLDATCREFLSRPLPLDASPVKFASWMGGDRDGNPNVTADTTREVCLQNRKKAASLFLDDLKDLAGELSLTTCSEELRKVVGKEEREPYRAFLKPILTKMQKTKEWAEQELNFLHKNSAIYAHHAADAIELDEVYIDQKEFMDDLLLMHRSLCETENKVTADGLLVDIIRNLSAFGLTLIPLDVRQESGRHEETMDAITRYLGLGSYAQWDEETKISWLCSQINSKRPLLRAGVWNKYPKSFSPNTVEALETFQMIAEQPKGSLGSYVISQATTASDVLAVLLLQIDAGRAEPLGVVPLFETLDDLNGAEETMKKLFSLPVYMGIINGKQQVMIGYSDSAKDAGRLAAVWAQFRTQELLSNVARANNVDLTFFHGKGGTVGRGGNPKTFEAITAHPPGTINGKFRVTEQGEVISQNFGYNDRAERTMDIYTAAVLTEKLVPRSKPPTQYRDMMDKLSDISCEAYRRVVRGDKRFVPYFRSATPETELPSLNIGSRPAKRNATGGVESLRAIPWNFSWTQTRFNLPTWLGVGEALGTVLEGDEKEAALVREMYERFDSFRTVVDLVEMVLSKSEPAIAKHYDDMLVSDQGAGSAKELGEELRSLHVDTERIILDLTQHSELGEDNLLLKRALAVRNPYVDCLNVLQAETLKRTRKYGDGEQSKDLKDALMTTIGGVAAGMGNTG